MNTLWINGRFIDRPVTGVERVAREVIRALQAHCLDADGCLLTDSGRLRVKLIAPRGTGGAREYLGIEVVRAGCTGGHLWEQIELPLLTRGNPLLSLCNTGPLRKRQHWIFLHDAQPFAIPDNFRRSVGLWYRFVYRQCGRRARSVLVNSRFTARELERLADIDTGKVRVCPLGADHAWDVVPEPVADLPDEPYLVAFASGNPNKNFAAVCAALDVLGDDAPLCLVVGEASPRVFAGAAASSSRVRQLGRLSDGQVATLLEGAHALCSLPSTKVLVCRRWRQ